MTQLTILMYYELSKNYTVKSCIYLFIISILISCILLYGTNSTQVYLQEENNFLLVKAKDYLFFHEVNKKFCSLTFKGN